MDIMFLFEGGAWVYGLGLFITAFGMLDSSIMGGPSHGFGILMTAVGMIWMVAFAVLKAVTLTTLLLGIGIPIGIMALIALVFWLGLR